MRRTSISLYVSTIARLRALQSAAGAASLEHLLSAVLDGVQVDALRAAISATPPARRGRRPENT